MVLVWQRCLLFVLVLSLTGLAGCIGDDPAPEPPEDDAAGPAQDANTPDVTTDAVPEPTKKVLSKVDAKQAVFAPTWSVGQWWTFEAGGVDRPESTSTFAVKELAEDHYKLGSDSEIELTYNVLNNGPFMPRSNAGIQFDSLAFYQADSYQDYIGFRRPVGDTWDVGIHGLKFTVTKQAVEEIEGPKGAAMGIVVSGATPVGHTLEVVYSAEAEWINTFVLADTDGAELLFYRLTDYGKTGAPEVQQWDRTGSFQINAQSPYYMADASSYTSDGSGDRLVVAMNLRNGLDGGQAHGSVYSPTGEEAATATVEQGAEWFYFFVDDAAGEWPVRTHALGADEAADRAKSHIYILQIKHV